MTAQEEFLQHLLNVDPDHVIAFATVGHPKHRPGDGLATAFWDEERLRQELRIPAPRELDERIVFTIDVPPPLGNLIPSYNTIRFCITTEALAQAAAAEMERGIHDGIAQRCLHLEEEVQRLSSPSVQAILQEVERARAKYPERDLESRFQGFAQEFGEALQAIVKMMMKPKFERPHEFQRAREEVIQAAGQAIRMLEEAL